MRTLWRSCAAGLLRGRRPRQALLMLCSSAGQPSETKSFMPFNDVFYNSLRDALGTGTARRRHPAKAQPAASCCRRTHARALLSDSDWSAGEDEFGSDDDLRTSSVDRGNAVLLSGPVGSGKTAAAYAVAMVRLLNMLSLPWVCCAH
jgi:hypothetical protein